MVGKIAFEDIDADDIFEGDQSANDRYVSQAYASQMAKIFRLTSCQIDAPPIFYLLPAIYRLQKPFRGVQTIYAEPLINVEDLKWERYMNNGSFCQNETMASFSHFSYIMSGGPFMITDLQGGENVLTDPAIHSEDRKTFCEPTNRGAKGIFEFFHHQHGKCNSQICKKLALERPDTEDDEYKEYIDIELKTNMVVPIFCDLCKKIEKVKNSAYKRIIEEGHSTFTCDDCTYELNSKKNLKYVTCKTQDCGQ